MNATHETYFQNAQGFLGDGQVTAQEIADARRASLLRDLAKFQAAGMVSKVSQTKALLAGLK